MHKHELDKMKTIKASKLQMPLSSLSNLFILFKFIIKSLILFATIYLIFMSENFEGRAIEEKDTIPATQETLGKLRDTITAKVGDHPLSVITPNNILYGIH